MTSIQNKLKVDSNNIQFSNFKLPKLQNATPRLFMFPSVLPTKEELNHRLGLRDEVLFSSSRKQSYRDYLRNDTQMQNSTLVKLSNGKYAFIDENGIHFNKDGPFWPKGHKLLHQLPKFIRENKYDIKEYYATKNEIKKCTNAEITPKVNTNYSTIWRDYLLIFDVMKSPRTQVPPVLSENYSPTLVFESRFESGNLRQARRTGQFEYELILRTDMFTERHTQWYFFKITNMLPNVTYRFRIINLRKKNSLYNEGLQPLMYSVMNAKKNNMGWHRNGHHISYYCNTEHRNNPLLYKKHQYYELDFQLEFPFEKDECYLTHCYPYTFTDLKDDIDNVEQRCQMENIFRKELLCETQAGNSCFLLSITDFNISEKDKVAIVVSGRVHPGETNSSFMMKGLIDYLTSNTPVAQFLRQNVIFKIVPMLNPDGVIVGNYRCSLAGKDLNRNYRSPQKYLFPTVWYLKDLINETKRDYNVFAYFDFHGHSRLSNVFTYGCANSKDPEAELFARVFPWLMAKKSPNMFAFESCKFHIKKSKESTSRVVMWRQFEIQNCYTLEASFAGTKKLDKPMHFSIKDYESIGKGFCEAMASYIEAMKSPKIIETLYVEITNQLLKNLAELKRRQEEEEALRKQKAEEAAAQSLVQEIEPERVIPETIDVSKIAPCTNKDDCLALFKQYNEDMCYESESSSDSDSESEPELPVSKMYNDAKSDVCNHAPMSPISKGGSSKSFPQRNTSLSFNEVQSSQMQEVAPCTCSNNRRNTDRSNSTIVPNTYNGKQKKQNEGIIKKRSSLFVSKYTNRTSNGMPIFTMERAEERLVQRQKRLDELNEEAKSQFLDETPEEYEKPKRKLRIKKEKEQPMSEIQMIRKSYSTTKQIQEYNFENIPVHNLNRENTLFQNINPNDLRQRKLTGSTLDMKFLNKLDTIAIKKPIKHQILNHISKSKPSTHAKNLVEKTIHSLKLKHSQTATLVESDFYKSYESFTEITATNFSFETETTKKLENQVFDHSKPFNNAFSDNNPKKTAKSQPSLQSQQQKRSGQNSNSTSFLISNSRF